VSNELASTPLGAPSRRWVAAMAGTALAAAAALALSIAAILSAGPPAVVGPEVATPAPLVRVTPAQERRVVRWWECVMKAPDLAATQKCLPGSKG
jgi:hypothetical protein